MHSAIITKITGDVRHEGWGYKEHSRVYPDMKMDFKDEEKNNFWKKDEVTRLWVSHQLLTGTWLLVVKEPPSTSAVLYWAESTMK